MNCSHCGTDVPLDNGYCPKCGHGLIAGRRRPHRVEKTPSRVAQPSILSRPGGLTLLIILDLLIAALFLEWTLVFLLAPFSQGDPVAKVIAICMGVIGVLFIRCGVGLWKLKRYGRILQLVFAWIGVLPFLPLSIPTLIYFSNPGVKILFSEKTTEQLLPKERSILAEAPKVGVVFRIIMVAYIALFAYGVLGVMRALWQHY